MVEQVVVSIEKSIFVIARRKVESSRVPVCQEKDRLNGPKRAKAALPSDLARLGFTDFDCSTTAKATAELLLAPEEAFNHTPQVRPQLVMDGVSSRLGPRTTQFHMAGGNGEKSDGKNGLFGKQCHMLSGCSEIRRNNWCQRGKMLKVTDLTVNGACP